MWKNASNNFPRTGCCNLMSSNITPVPVHLAAVLELFHNKPWTWTSRWDLLVKFLGPRTSKRNQELWKCLEKKKVDMIFGRLWKASEQLLYWPVVHCNQCLYRKHKLISSWTCLSWYISKLLFHKRIQTCNYWFFCYNDDTSAPPSKRLQSLSFCVLRWISVSVSCMMLDSCCALGLWKIVHCYLPHLEKEIIAALRWDLPSRHPLQNVQLTKEDLILAEPLVAVSWRSANSPQRAAEWSTV